MCVFPLEVSRGFERNQIFITFKNKPYFLIKPVFYIIFLFCFLKLHAQESLVPNGSFENLINCPQGADLFNAQGWFSPNEGTPDLFNSCADVSTNYSVPTNAFGYQAAQNGTGYAGIVTYSYNGNANNFREYLVIKLNTTLSQNSIYNVCFYYNQANLSPLATNNLSFGFCSDTNGFYLLDIIEPDFHYFNKNLTNDTSSWYKIESIYIGNGNENFILIGNFFNDSDTDTLSTGMLPADVYYFVDNISVLEVGLEIENVFSPNQDGVNEIAFYDPFLSKYEVLILNRWGELVYKTNFEKGWNGTNFAGVPLLDGVYFYSVINPIDNKKIKAGFIHLVR